MNGIEEDRFRVSVELIEIQTRTAEAFGDSDLDPVGGAVTDAFEALRIDEGFGQENGMVVAGHPIVAEAVEIQTENLGSQMGTLGFGLEDEEAGVAGNQMTGSLALGIGPPDPSVAVAEMEGAAGPAEQGDPLSVLLGDVTQGLADQAMFLEVMAFADQFVPAIFFLRSGQLDDDLLGREFLQSGCDRVFGWTAVSGRMIDHALRLAKRSADVPNKISTHSPTPPCAPSRRSRALEPVLMLGVSILQDLDGVPDRPAVEMLRYHAGWNFALNRQLGDPVFHPTSLVNFRNRLEEHQQSAVAFQTVLDALQEVGLVWRQSRQRLDSTQMFGRVAKMNRLDCVRESMRLALKELEEVIPAQERPPFWVRLWERSVESQVDYRASAGTLGRKLGEAGADAWQLLEWLSQPSQSDRANGAQGQ